MPRPSGLVIRRSVVALGGGACAAFGAVLLAHFAQPQLHAEAAPAPRPMIIDGPPTQVEAAPPPPRLRRRMHRRIEPFENDGDEFEAASAGAPFQGGPGQGAPYPEHQGPQGPQGPMPPPQQAQAGQMQTAEMGAYGARARPQDPCAGPAGPADQMVCASPRLSAADEALRRLYNMDLYRTDNPDALRAEQRRWRAVRDQAAAEGGPEALAELYAERIQELDGPY